MDYQYGPAAKKDCAAIAEFVNMASDGVVEYLFHDLKPWGPDGLPDRNFLIACCITGDREVHEINAGHQNNDQWNEGEQINIQDLSGFCVLEKVYLFYIL